MPDVRVKVTPDFKHADDGAIFLLPLSEHHRLGGSALAQTFGQIGEECPDLDDPHLLKHAFEVCSFEHG
jgi:phosphoribosylformylglycinamidine synthase